MLKRLMLGLMALVAVSSTAHAQSFPVPADILAAGHWGSDGWDERVPTYKAGTAQNVLGDGTTINGGTPPGAAFEFADVPADLTGWVNTGAQSQNYFCDLVVNGGECQEPKARFTAEITHYANDDPIRNYCKPGTSHLHMFFGNASTNSCTTFQTLRANAAKYSHAAGGPANGTAYWFPAITKENPFGDGKNYVVRIGHVTFYYREPTPSEAKKNTYLMLGLRYVSGFNMDDANAWLDGLIATANAQAGTANRYKRCVSTSETVDCNGIVQWNCNGLTARSFRNADGTDPYGGACTADKDIVLNFTAPQCWDGRNFWSPGGYKHVIPAIYDTVIGAPTCPDGWWRIPQLIFNITIEHEGPSDYMNWKLSSDPITGSASTGTLAGKTVRRGETFHIDWFNGWMRAPMRQWHDNCIGIANNPHECLDSTVGPNLRLHRAEPAPAPYARPQTVSTARTFGTASPSTMWPIKTAQPSMVHVH